MATIVSFHAHPDDESIATGGTMARYAAEGHRVVLVVGTRGEQGEPVPGVLADGEALWERRVVETRRSAEILGAARVEFLGYEDSGMMGEHTNENPACFWQADLDEAAGRLAAILRDEQAHVLTVYDDHGGYGHPDHIQVHRVGVRAAELAGTPHVFESTMNRDFIKATIEEARAMADAASEPPEQVGDEAEEVGAAMDISEDDVPDTETFGSPADLITHAVDVSAFVGQKRDSMRAHASQIGPDHFFLSMSDEAFARAFSTEWYIERGGRAGGEPFADDLLAGVGDRAGAER